MATGRRGNAAGSAANARGVETTIHHGDGDVTNEDGEVLAHEPEHDVEGQTKRILSMAAAPPEDRELQTDDADLPVLSWEDTAEVRGGNLTDMGFAKLMPGFEFRGYVLGTKKVPSEFGKEEPIIDPDSNRPVLDPVTRQPMTRKMQEVYLLKGTARFPVKGATPNTFGQCAGRMQIPVYARLVEPVAENAAKEQALTEKARRTAPSAPAVKIPLHIKYVGQNPDKETAEGQKARSGAHLFTVARLRVTEAAA